MTEAAPHPDIDALLTGGHPNSLGNTVEVAEGVLAARWSLDDLLDTYRSTDAVVRLRVSSALKRVTAADPDRVATRIRRLLDEVAAIDQASAQWTLALVFNALRERTSDEQRTRATAILLRNLRESDDWIVQNQTMAVLAEWAASDPALRDQLEPELHRLVASPRKSVAGRARKLLGLPHTHPNQDPAG